MHACVIKCTPLKLLTNDFFFAQFLADAMYTIRIYVICLGSSVSKHEKMIGLLACGNATHQIFVNLL